MNKKDGWLIVAIIVIAAMLIVTVTLILEQKKSTDALQESAYISEIDSLISKGALETAEESILELARKDLSAASYIRLLKRAYSISRHTTSYSLFNSVTGTALAAYPARTDLAALRIYGLLRTDRVQSAVEVYNSRDLESDEWPRISSEVSLYGESSTSEQVLSEKSEAEDFLRMYQKTESYGFLLDGLLILLREGKVQSAYSTAVEDNNLSELPPEFAFLLLFDSKHWPQAEDVLDRYPQLYSKVEYLFLTADVYMFQQKMEKASTIYKNLLLNNRRMQTTYKSRALLNLLYIHDTQNRELPGEFVEKISQVAKEDPEHSALLFAGYYLSRNRPDRAQNLLNISAETGEQNLMRQIIQEETGETVNPERYKALLWRLVYRTEKEKYAQYLAWFLLGIEDIGGLESLVEYGNRAYGTKAWVQFYEAVLHMYSRDYEKAADLFKTAFETEAQWEYLYNAALNYSALDNINSALDELKTAKTVVAEDSQGNTVISAEQIELLIQSGRYSEARRELNIFENKFPNNMSAGLLRSLLEARTGD